MLTGLVGEFDEAIMKTATLAEVKASFINWDRHNMLNRVPHFALKIENQKCTPLKLFLNP